MALIKCVECGKEISSNAFSCPNCGNPMKNITNPQQVRVFIHREKKMMLFSTTGTVRIDGKVIGSAGNGASYDIYLSAGHHTITIESGMPSSARSNVESKSFTIPADAKSVRIELKATSSLVREPWVTIDSIRIS